MTDVESGAAVTATEAPSNATAKQEQSPVQRNGGAVKDDGSTVHSAPVPYYNGGAQMKRPPPPQPPPKMFFAPQKYGFFTMNNVEQRWRDDPDKEKKSQADDIIANVTEKFFPGAKRAAEPTLPVGPPFMPAPPGMPGIPPPPFIMPPAPQGPPKDAKRIKFNDEDSDENELFAKLLYKKLKSIASRKRLEILHVSIMEMVRQAQEEDERERGVVNTGSIPAPPPTTT
ncbi:unnamed protein product [Haemonchus placei]|uniref:WW domain-binding protein 11 n=1 Tax=Haemonchus placei TaxID=6290 RepID=A0A0N4WDF0_HAEPC|nr:unnamed protein product [Haemonchus placei]